MWFPMIWFTRCEDEMTATRLGFPHGREKVNLAMDNHLEKKREQESRLRSVYSSL